MLLVIFAPLREKWFEPDDSGRRRRRRRSETITKGMHDSPDLCAALWARGSSDVEAMPPVVGHRSTVEAMVVTLVQLPLAAGAGPAAAAHFLVRLAIAEVDFLGLGLDVGFRQRGIVAHLGVRGRSP